MGVSLTLKAFTLRPGQALRTFHVNERTPSRTGLNTSPESPVRNDSSPTDSPSAKNSAETIAGSESEYET